MSQKGPSSWLAAKGVTRRFAVVTILVWAGLLAALHGPGPGAMLEEGIALPLSFAARDLMGRTPPIDPRLKIFSLDDGAFALLRRPHLTGQDWTHLLTALGGAHPAAVVTTHMFGAGEIDEDDGLLGRTLTSLQLSGTRVAAAVFAYPGRISHREPLSLERGEFKAPPPAYPTPLDGWLLYGPEPAHAARFGELGHVGYDGHGRASPYVRLAEGRTVPHLGVAAVDGLKLEAVPPPPVDRHGRVLVDLAPRDAYAERTKSLRVLLEGDPNAYAARNIQPGDFVLVLMDMYTGRASFVATPEGQLPGGYVVAAMLSSALRGQWLRERSFNGAASVLAAAAGAAAGAVFSGAAFALALAAGAVLIALSGLGIFVVWGVSIPWIPALAAFTGLAMTLYGRKISARFAAERNRSEQTDRETAKLNAIVRTAQMFAHDVRKPFSMLNMAVQSLKGQKDPQAAARMLSGLLPELNRAMVAVEGMIQDVMEIDASTQLNIEAAHLVDVISESLRDVFLIRDNASVSVAYDLRHTLPAAIDRDRVRRVIGNLIDNAIQAMDGYGRLWVNTRDAVFNNQSFIEVCLGNGGSFVPPEDLSRVFEAFYTRGKKGGTGLGLAIAHKVVTQHGGRIWCESERGKGTEFFFTLPVARVTPQAPETAPRLPATAAEYRRAPASVIPAALRGHDRALQVSLQEQLAQFRSRRGRRFRTLVVDDEAVYLESLLVLLANAAGADLLELATSRDAAEAEAACARSAPDLAICDVDLGPGSKSGFELIEGLRKGGFTGSIMVHSNRVMPNDASRSQAIGADVFLPKPAVFGNLVSEILRALRRAADDDGAPPEADWVAVVDDNAQSLAAWESALSDARVLAFPSPTAFWARIGDEPALMGRLAGVITDYYFDQEGEDTGAAFAKALKTQRHDLPVFLTSDGVFPDLADGVVDAKIGKEPLTWGVLKAQLRNAS